ncbi:MAG: hypothetical protein DWQ49_09825 [Bacteroidetes bacterium]|nr:MAG: hypothetical protein DWQ49_09825 [Bacteroidota bacterium]
MTVFVTQYTPHANFTELNKYSDNVVFLTDKEYKPEPTVPRFNNIVDVEIKSKMEHYIPGEDYIVTTGSAIPNVLAGMMLARKKGPHKILKWNNYTKQYELFLIRTN